MQLHWAESLAEKVKKQYKPPFVVSGGMTTSGPTHFGTVCEFLFPGTVQKILKKQGFNAKFYFVADILDAFDSVPKSMVEYEKELTPHLGKPLCNVPDPTKKSNSFGDHYLDEAKKIMDRMELDVALLRANDLYNQGKFDYYAKLFLDNRELSKKVVEESSQRELSSDWYPIMPICQNCGKIATTRATSYDNNSEEYSYVCDKDVKYTKGCGFEGKNKLTDHKYKIVWRLHWPAWHRLLKTNLEGAGIDHHTKGGSYDTVIETYKQIFKEQKPIGYRFGFILFKGGKYSKSKGTGMGVAELSKLIPPQLIAYSLIKPDLSENIDIVPTKENLVRLYDEFEKIGKISSETKDLEKLDRPIQKKVQAYRLCPGGLKWGVQFSDVLMAYQIYSDWKKVSDILKDENGIVYLRPFVENWIKKDFVPDNLKFEYVGQKLDDDNLRKVLESINSSMDGPTIQNTIYQFSKDNNLQMKEVFKKFYQHLIGKDRGPRLGNLIKALGVERVKSDLV